MVLGLGKGHDGVQEDTAELMAQAACSIVSGCGKGERPEVRLRR